MKKKILNCGIYKIENILNGDCYIGQSIRLSDRKNIHFSKLRNNKHHSSYLQNSFNKYGEENFVFKIILYCEPNELTYYEQSLVDMWNPKYNSCIECVDSRMGVSQTNNTKQKISKGMKSKWSDEEYREKTSQSMRGIKRSEEFCQNMSDARMGIGAGIGYFHSEETKDKISKSKIGKPRDEETRKKISLGKSGINILSIDKVINIKNMLNLGKTIEDICNILKVGNKTVIKVRDGWYKKFYGI